MTSLQPREIRVGVDFDNTLVSYDSLIRLVAEDLNLISGGVPVSKKLIRDAIRKLPNGEEEWQKIQGLIYGPRISEATPSEGVTAFLSECFWHGVKVDIVSHKTEFAKYDETCTNLRSAAMSWLNKNRIVGSGLYGLSSDNIYFESTRKDKVNRIRVLGCTHFIDDLEETFLETSFPSTVKRLLYSPHSTAPTVDRFDLSGDWREITKYFLNVIG